MVLKIVLFGLLYFFLFCFGILLILIYKAPEYVEMPDGSMMPKPKEKGDLTKPGQHSLSTLSHPKKQKAGGYRDYPYPLKRNSSRKVNG